jgi:hypothetical protein
VLLVVSIHSGAIKLFVVTARCQGLEGDDELDGGEDDSIGDDLAGDDTKPSVPGDNSKLQPTNNMISPFGRITLPYWYRLGSMAANSQFMRGWGAAAAEIMPTLTNAMNAAVDQSPLAGATLALVCAGSGVATAVTAYRQLRGALPRPVVVAVGGIVATTLGGAAILSGCEAARYVQAENGTLPEHILRPQQRNMSNTANRFDNTSILARGRQC